MRARVEKVDVLGWNKSVSALRRLVAGRIARQGISHHIDRLIDQSLFLMMICCVFFGFLVADL